MVHHDGRRTRGLDAVVMKEGQRGNRESLKRGVAMVAGT